MDEQRERLETIARIQQTAEAKREQLWHRAPFVWTVVLFLLGALATGAIWTASIQWRLSKEEEFSITLKTDGDRHEGIIEEVHNDRRDIDRTSKQMRALNRKIYKTEDPGTDE